MIILNFIDDIKDNSLLIIPNTIKDKVLDYINSKDRLINTKIISLNELKKELLFEIDDESTAFLMSKYNLKKEVIEEYLSNLYYIDDNISNDKINALKEMKDLLDEKGFIIKRNRLLNYYKDKDIYVYGYDYIDKFNKRLLDNFNNVHIIDKETINDKVNVYEFDTLNDEIYFILEKVCSLIDSGVPLDNIVITNLDDDYKREISKLFNMSNINICIDNTSPIISTIIGNDIINKLYEYKDLEKTLEYFLNTYNMNDEYNNKMYLKVLNIFNKYNTYKYDFNIIYECIKNDFNKIKLNRNEVYGIRVEDISNNVFDDDTYVFMTGFNEGKVPRIHKDEDYLSDNIKKELGLDTTSDINRLEKESLINNIKSIKNIFISYKHKYVDEYYASSLIDNITLINTKYDIDYNKSYSITYSKLKLASLIDDLIKYDNKSDYLNTLYNSIEIPYREFDNNFKGINKDELKEYLNNYIKIAYSNLSTFYNCKFRYYLDRILKINVGEDIFDAYIGNIFHYVLSNINKKDFDLDYYWNKFIKENRELTPKEEFYLNKLKKELVIVVDFLNEFNKETGLSNMYLEKDISIDKSNELNVIFNGKVDKILYGEYDNNTLVSIVDYKTGSAKCDLRDTIYGLSMQLPIYLYLVDKGNIFDSYRLAGFYLQRILDKEVKINDKNTYIEEKKNNLKLNGYSTDDMTTLSRFDPSYEKSNYIASLSVTKEGRFSANSKVLSETEINNLIKLVDNKIDQMVKDIENARFDINPKMLSNEDFITGCKYCSYKDICFRRNENIVNLEKKDDYSFLESGDV